MTQPQSTDMALIVSTRSAAPLTGRPQWQALAKRAAAEIASFIEPRLAHDSSTNALIRRYREWRALRA